MPLTEQEDQLHLLRRCTYAGRAFEEEAFVTTMEEHFERRWRLRGFDSGGAFNLAISRNGTELSAGLVAKLILSILSVPFAPSRRMY
jgi:hypothetical protein